jgi:hypothetical protein
MGVQDFRLSSFNPGFRNARAHLLSKLSLRKMVMSQSFSGQRYLVKQ